MLGESGQLKKSSLLVYVLHDVSGPGQLDLQLPPVLHEEVHQRAGDRGRGVEEERRDPENGAVQLLQAQEEVVAVLDGQQVVVVLLQDAGVEGGHVGAAPHVPPEDLRRSEVAAEDVVVLLDLSAAARAGEDPAVAHHGADVVALVEDGRGLRQQRAEVLADGVHVLVAGVVEVHQLADAHRVSGQREVVGDVDVLRDLLPAGMRTASLKGSTKSLTSDSFLFFVPFCRTSFTKSHKPHF